MDKFSLFAEFAKPVPKTSYITELLDDDAKLLEETKAFSVELSLTMLSAGDTAIIINEFDPNCGRIGTLTAILDEMFVMVDESSHFVTERASVQKLVSPNQLTQAAVVEFFDDIKTKIHNELLDMGVEDTDNLVKLLNVEFTNLICNHSYGEIVAESFTTYCAESVLLNFPKIKHGVIDMCEGFELFNELN